LTNSIQCNDLLISFGLQFGEEIQIGHLYHPHEKKHSAKIPNQVGDDKETTNKTMKWCTVRGAINRASTYHIHAHTQPHYMSNRHHITRTRTTTLHIPTDTAPRNHANHNIDYHVALAPRNDFDNQKNPQTGPAILPDKSPRVLCTTPRRGYICLNIRSLTYFSDFLT